MTTVITKKKAVLDNLSNHNNVLRNEYFGQIRAINDNWQELIGKTYEMTHPGIGANTFCKFIGLFPVLMEDMINELDYLRYIKGEQILTMRELTGMDEETLYYHINTSELAGERTVGLYIFKNLTLQLPL